MFRYNSPCQPALNSLFDIYGRLIMALTDRLVKRDVSAFEKRFNFFEIVQESI